MARPYWSGQIQISLVSFGVKLFVATEAKSEIHFHQIDRKTGERVRHQKVLASAIDQSPEDAAAPVERNRIVKGYEYTKGQYVTIEPEELEHLRVPSKHAMEVTQFVDREEIGPEYFEKPYFVLPENDAQSEAFSVVRKALIDTKKIALSKIAFGGREHVVAIVPAGSDEHPGMMLYTMRYQQELRDPAEYFREVKKGHVDADSLGLAKELIKRKAGHFDPSQFVDGYEVALKELVEAKVQHAPVPKDEPAAKPSGKVINLMDALRKSISSGASELEEAKPAAKKKPSAKAEEKKGPTLVKAPVKTTKPTKTAPRRRSA